jgi:hypothetical protein
MASIPHVVKLLGGVRDGQVTRVDEHTQRLYTPSDAPGLLDVYDRTAGQTEVPDVDGPVGIFELSGQVSAEDVAPELLHMPGADAVPGDT